MKSLRKRAKIDLMGKTFHMKGVEKITQRKEKIMKKRIFRVVSLLLVSSTLVGCGRLTVTTDNTKESVETDDTKESEDFLEKLAERETEKSNTLSTIDSYYVYDYVDPETGVHYLIYAKAAGYVGMGGITPRLNADGSLMVDEKEKSGYQRD